MKTEIETEETAKTTEMVQEIGIERVVADPEQPRKVFDLAGLQGLAESIKENGIVQPLIVAHPDGAKGDKFTLVAGERRLRAAKLAGLKSVPCIVRAVKNVFGAQMVENLQRENLSALEEAAALARRVNEGRTAEQLAKELGISRATVFAKLRLNSLSEPVKQELLKGNITASVAGLIAMVPGESQKEFLKEVTSNHGFEGPMSYRRAEELLERNYARQLSKATFDTKVVFPWEKGMVEGPAENGARKKAVTCQDCPRRTGNMEGSGLKNGNVCTVPRCFELKTKAEGALKAELARKQGRTVLEGKDTEKLFSEYGDEGVEHGSGFVELEGRADVLGWEEKKTYRQVLGQNLVGGKGVAEVKVVVAIDREGRARELVAREEAVKVLKECGKLKPEKPDASEVKWQKEHRERQAEEKVRKAEVDAIVGALVREIEALPENKLNQFWFVAAQGMRAVSGFYLSEPVRKRRGWEAAGHGAVEQELRKLTVQGMAAYAVELACSRDEDAMNAVCSALKIDQKALAKEARESLKKPKGKSKQEETEKTEKPKTKAAEDSRTPKPGGGSKGQKAKREAKGKKMGGKKMGKGKTKGAQKS